MREKPTPRGNAAVVEGFYSALTARDGAAVSRLVLEKFAEEASVVFPASLPYGGRVTGASRLAKMFAYAATSTAKQGAVGLVLTDIAGDGNRVAARVEFDWYGAGTDEPLRTSAVEWWQFSEGLVSTVEAYYWDTAALSIKPTPTS